MRIPLPPRVERSLVTVPVPGPLPVMFSNTLGVLAEKVALTVVLAETVTVHGETEHPPPEKLAKLKLGDGVAVRVGVAPEA